MSQVEESWQESDYAQSGEYSSYEDFLTRNPDAWVQIRAEQSQMISQGGLGANRLNQNWILRNSASLLGGTDIDHVLDSNGYYANEVGLAELTETFAEAFTLVGDVMAVQDFIDNPTLLGGIIAGFGMVPLVGDAASVALRRVPNGYSRQGDTLIDEAGNVFTPVGTTVDGRIIFRNAEGTPVVLDDIPTGNPTIRLPDNVDYMAEAAVTQADSLVSPESARHILYGDGFGSGGHLWPGNPNKTPFPQSWDETRILNTIDEIVSNPNTQWYVQNGGLNGLTAAGDAGKFISHTNVPGSNLPVRVIYEPSTGRVVTAFPDPNPIPPTILNRPVPKG